MSADIDDAPKYYQNISLLTRDMVLYLYKI
jgi:hypothetical protein